MVLCAIVVREIVGVVLSVLNCQRAIGTARNCRTRNCQHLTVRKTCQGALWGGVKGVENVRFGCHVRILLILMLHSLLV